VTTPDIPAEAVEAVRDVARSARLSEGSTSGISDRTLIDMLAAALPHLHERWLAEVEGALRKEADRVQTELRPFQLQRDKADEWALGIRHAANHLRDVLGAEGNGT